MLGGLGQLRHVLERLAERCRSEREGLILLELSAEIAIAVALIRVFSRASVRTIGNFWVDVTRTTLYVLLPICVVYALFLVWQGMPQTLGAYVEATTLEGAKQTIAVGPVASQVAIKMLGTNGGGFFNANAAHPFENPTALSNFVQMLSIFAIGAAVGCGVVTIKNCACGSSCASVIETSPVPGGRSISR